MNHMNYIAVLPVIQQPIPSPKLEMQNDIQKIIMIKLLQMFDFAKIHRAKGNRIEAGEDEDLGN